ncbi:NAD(P)/FAD-dependent oxidoreductase [Nocardioides montaniterrae]
MTDHIEQIVVVGAGLAGAKAVEALRAEGYAGGVTLVGKEPDPPYERPQLSKDLLIDDKEFALTHDAQWYADHDVTLRTATTATAIDVASSTVALADGDVLPFDRLLLATGASPRRIDIPGADTAQVLRTITDARNIKDQLTEGKHLVLVGGGWIGLELAAAARSRGAQATVLEAADLPLRNLLGQQLAEHLVEIHRRHGVDVRTDVKVERIDADGVTTTEGRIDADLVVLAVGATPDTRLAEDAGLRVDNGIVTDQHLRTSAPHVYAAGDVARAEHTVLGPLRVEHWDNAKRQGELAARNMLGGNAAYDWAPYFFTDQFELSMEYVGHAAPDDVVEIRGDLENDKFIAYWLRNDVVTAAMNVGIWDVNDQLRALVGQRFRPIETTG